MKRINGFVAVLALTIIQAFVLSVSAANAQDWTVAKVSGQVIIVNDGVQLASFGKGNAVDGGTIKTGANGRVLLMRGRERMLVRPNSEVEIPRGGSSESTTIYQRAGQLVFDVEKRNVRHFAVQTPYLAAVVKGTQFIVTVTGRAARVDVYRGSVEVSDRGSDQVVDIEPGQSTQTVSRRRRGLMVEAATGDLPKIHKRANKPGNVAPGNSSALAPGRQAKLEVTPVGKAKVSGRQVASNASSANGNSGANSNAGGNGNGNSGGSGNGNSGGNGNGNSGGNGKGKGGN